MRTPTPLSPFLTRLLTAAALLASGLLAAQTTALRVLDEKGLPVIGATVELLGDALGNTGGEGLVFVTDNEGVVAFPSDVAPAQVRVRYVGYAPRVTSVAELTPDDTGALVTSVVPAQEVLAQAVVRAVRAKPADPFAFEDVDGETLAAANPGQDIPFLLRRTPGAVYTSDAGTGIGYSGIRVRGADATRVNVTVNGVPLNDSESQGVFWVNMPDFVSSTSSLQLQRGVGESTYGAGAFGANLNLVTNAPSSSPQLTAELGGGSFGTARGMLRANTGDIGGFSAEARASYIRSEGFVDRASSRLGSAYLGTSWAISDEQRLQLIGWTGKERTYQAWFGIPESFANDPDLRTFNPAGALADGGFYDDQVDDYRQSHAQLLYTRALERDWLLQLTGHYTKGRGFFEEWENGIAFGRFFPLGPQTDDRETDLVQRRWLDNDFYGAIATVSGGLSPKLNSTFSAGYSRYVGDHFGTVPLVVDPDLAPLARGDYYRNDATKDDFNAFAKTNYQVTRDGSLYLDLQLRHVRYDANLVPGDESARRAGDFTFFNPKVGWTQRIVSGFGASPQRPSNAYASVAVGQREPNRNDFQDADNGVTPRPEKLYNLELGLRSSEAAAFSYELGGYAMVYDDQLALTGALNEVGEAIRVNIDDSYRIGLELAAAYRFGERASGSGQSGWRLEGNVALSRNRIVRFEERVDNFGTGGQDVILREDVPLAFSPEVVANLGLSYAAATARGGQVAASLWGSFVAEQFVDNSGSEVAALPAYGRADLELRYLPTGEGRVLFTLQLQNLTNAFPITNGYSYRYRSPGYDPRPDDPYSISEGNDYYIYKGVYPQAGFQAMAGVRLQLTGATR